MVGSSDDDTIATLGSKAQLIEGGAGADTLTSTADDDITVRSGVSYASSPQGVTVNLKTPSASGGHAEGDTLSGLFTRLVGSSHDDTLTGTASADNIEGGPGNDTLNGGDYVDAGGHFYFFSGFGDDTVNSHQAPNDLFVCIDNATFTRDHTTVRTLITVYESNGNKSGTITIPGNWTEDQVDVVVEHPDTGECKASVLPVSAGETLRVWRGGNTPYLPTSEGTARLFLRVYTNLSATAKCKLAGLPLEGDDGTLKDTHEINCPPTTLVSLVPIKGANGDTATVTALATIPGTASANAMIQKFQRGRHRLPPMTTSADDGRIKVSWTTGQSVTGTNVNGHEVAYRLLRQNGAWISSGLLGASTTSHTLIGLTNWSTYEIRVRTRNDAGDSTATANWWSPWDYDTATPIAAD